MKASDCTFDKMMANAKTIEKLAFSTSYVQVEFGVAELCSHWQGFVDTSDHYEMDFKSQKHIAKEFASALYAYLRQCDDDFPKQVGQAVSPNRRRGKGVE